MSGLSKKPIRYLITRGNATDLNYSEKKAEIIDIIRRAAYSAIEMVQLREKNLSAGRLFDLALLAVEVAAGSGMKILVNDRFDVAVAAGADGVHLTGLSLPTQVVRQNVPDGFLVGRSTHSLDETIAECDSADFVMFGPIFKTPGKGNPTGLSQLREVCDAAGELPVIAIGGIDKGSYESVLENGAAGYAAIRYLNDFVMMKK